MNENGNKDNVAESRLSYRPRFTGWNRETLERIKELGEPEIARLIQGAQTAQERQQDQKQAELSILDLTPKPEQAPELALPEGISEGQPPYIITGKRILVVADVHVPFHDVQALAAAIKYGQDVGIDTLLINGDFCDFYAVSRWERRPDRRNLKWELDIARDILSKIRAAFPGVKIVYKLGNHDERWDSYIMQKAPELWGIEELAIESLLHLQEHDIECVKDKRVIRAGKLSILHGHEWFGGGGVNVARNYMLKAKDNILGAHHHRTQESIAKKVTGEVYGGWSQGCLCDLNPAYAPQNDWNHGFVDIEVMESGNFRIENKKVYKGEVL